MCGRGLCVLAAAGCEAVSEEEEQLQRNKSVNLDLLLRLLAALAELGVALGEQIHLKLQLIDFSLQLLLQLQALGSTFHLHVQTGLQGLQRPLVAFSNGAEELSKCLYCVRLEGR